MTAAEIKAERARLNGLLAVRMGKPGYSKNVAAIKQALANLDKEKPTDV